MKKVLAGLALLIAACLRSGSYAAEAPGGRVTIDIVYDNMISGGGLEPDWGFACVVRGLEKTVLFDTGGDAALLLSNMKMLGIDPGLVGAVVISHSHGDHAGGLAGFLKVNRNVDVFVPMDFPTAVLAPLGEMGIEAVTAAKPLRFGANAWLSGTIGEDIREQAFIIDSDSGAVVIVGCSHPGIVEIAERAQALTGKNVYMIIGGLHLKDMPEDEVAETVDRLKRAGLRYAAPSHCTGEAALRILKDIFGGNFIESGAGKRIEIAGIE